MAGAKSAQGPEEGGVCITVALITKRNLTFPEDEELSEKIIRSSKLRTWLASPPCDEFPQSLLILNLSGNSCTNRDGYRELVTEALPLLLDLDGQPVSERWISDEEDEASNDDEFPELSGPFCSERGFLKELEQELSRHRERRQHAALTEHLLRMDMQPALTDLLMLPRVPMAGDSSPSVTPGEGKETLPEAVSSPQSSSPTKKPCTVVPRSQQSSLWGRKGVRAATAPKASVAGAPSTTKTMPKRSKK
ncbi:leucine-rich repeat-containing protein 46 isoform X3 [Cebus imitator]|uniref:leucine-rich repeat-containing protein 46 isoform X3 n=1 Tax=Cebus imitator TaxID=2715852 RepID=UPI00080A6E05|nr:leucine-rich repeat-containing protein 46 isoform X3 [Cebus imitator]